MLGREIKDIPRTGIEGAPEGAAILSFPHPVQIDLSIEGPFFEGLGEVRVVDVIAVAQADLDRKIVVSVYDRMGLQDVVSS